MRTVRFSQFGDPEDVLHLEEMPVPEPISSQVRVRLTHRPINPSDLETIRGRYGRLPGLPATPGMEGLGIVDAVGEEVKSVALGQRVVLLGGAGTWREYILSRPQNLISVPDGLADESAVQFVGNPVSAWVMLHELGLKEGDWLLQTAAGSTLGRLVIQLAKVRGIRTVNLVRRYEQVEELLEFGADAAFCTADEDVVEQVRAFTGGKGVHGAIDAVGGKTGAMAADSLRPGKTLIVYGMLSNEDTPVNNGRFLFRGLNLKGFWVSYWFRTTPPEEISRIFGELMGLMMKGDLAPPVEATYDLGDVQAAVAHAQRPGNRGKVLLTG